MRDSVGERPVFLEGAQERVLPRDRVQRLPIAARFLRDAWIRQQPMRTAQDPGIHSTGRADCQ